MMICAIFIFDQITALDLCKGEDRFCRLSDLNLIKCLGARVTFLHDSTCSHGRVVRRKQNGATLGTAIRF